MVSLSATGSSLLVGRSVLDCWDQELRLPTNKFFNFLTAPGVPGSSLVVAVPFAGNLSTTKAGDIIEDASVPFVVVVLLSLLELRC